ncbi:MAG: group III truncated hemoglobin [Trinickia sp.]|uniref:group III truncated hemoglobin n=1 Tax=Trinickia sp. TaxID=2571163 RepID=UPI003F80CDA3
MSTSLPSGHSAPPPADVSPVRHREPTEANVRELVYAFYDRVRADSLLGPVFDAVLEGRWDEHLPKMCLFWGSLVLGDKRYRGNVQQAHQPLEGLEPRHFSRWLHLFLDTVCDRYEPAAAVRFMEPALRIAQSLQLSRFGWDYAVPPEQQALLDRVAPKRARADSPGHGAHATASKPREPFPAKIIGRSSDPQGEPSRDD